MKPNSKQAELLQRMQVKSPGDYFKFIDGFRRIYNSCCPGCQKKIMATGGNVTLESLCETCKPKAESILEGVEKILEKHGGKIRK